MTKDPIREAIEMLKGVDPGDSSVDMYRVQELLAEGEKKLPFPCSICGVYGCMRDHGY